MGGKQGKVGALALAFAALTVAAVAAPLATAHSPGLNVEGRYEFPSSYRIAPIPVNGGIAVFGIGSLLCDPDGGQGRGVEAPDLQAATGIANGACWSGVGDHQGETFSVTGSDALFGGDVSLSVIFDYTGTGCTSASCGVPAEARFSGCGAVDGNVPLGMAGDTVWVFVRVVDVDPFTGSLCLGSGGDLFGSF